MPCQFQKRIPELTANLVALYRRKTTDSDIALGSAWYPNARDIVRQWSATYGVPVDTVACVIAAISPQCSWDRNLIIADDILAERPASIGSLRSNVDKARRILTDRASRTFEYFPQGPKVASFSLNLAGNDTAVTVDTHAMQAALNDVQANYRLPWQPYVCFASVYGLAARKVQHPSAEFQAIIWHTWKRLHPAASKRAARQQWAVMGEY